MAHEFLDELNKLPPISYGIMKWAEEALGDTMVDLLLKDTVGESDGEPITLAYLKDGGPGEETRTMRTPLRKWLAEYIAVARERKVLWQTSKEVDSTGGDLVRIWTADLAGTSLADDCDFVVWQMPDDTIGEDFVKFLSRN